MAAKPVEWVLVVYYGPSAHRAAYGRLSNTKYTKDYIQLSRRADFLSALRRLFPSGGKGTGQVPITYQWHNGSTRGALVFKSADRPHLKWGTSQAPQVWKMSLTPSETTAETIPGNPQHEDFSAAENEFKLLRQRGAGQPYFLVIKLRDDSTNLHLRAYLENPSPKYAWADLAQVPPEIQAIATKTSARSALAWSTFRSLLFDPNRNHDAWHSPTRISAREAISDNSSEALRKSSDAASLGDAAAERSESDPKEVEAFRGQIAQKSFDVPDSSATVKTRGSAQRAFAQAVKKNYGYRCAVTGIVTPSFLVASHIVPWSADQTIRLDPSNGICLSVLMDRAFENGHLIIDDDLTIHIDKALVERDQALRKELERIDGKKLEAPKKARPRVEYLRRRRELIRSQKKS
jgi:hypothetical protein